MMRLWYRLRKRPGVGRLVGFCGGPFDGEERFVAQGTKTLILSLIHDDNHPQYQGYSGPQEYEVGSGGASYVGPRPNPTTEDEDGVS